MTHSPTSASKPQQHNAIRSAQVVIVGAGPTGACAATLLAQYGIDNLVLDRWDGVYPQPRAVHLDDEVFRVLARMGVAEQFAAISRPALGLQFRDRSHRVLAEFRRDIAPSVHGFPQASMFDQPELETLLRENLSRYPEIELRGNTEVTGLEQLGDGRLRLTCSDRIDGTKIYIDTDFVLGCDGANSFVRSAIGSTMTDLHFQQRWVVVDVHTTADLGQWDGVHQVCDPARAATYMRIGDTRYRWEFQLLSDETASDFSDAATLKPLIAPWTGTVRDDQLELIRVAEYTFRAQIADRWRQGNVFLLGDAAHLSPPFIGQGMGAGLRDAMNLAWKLAGVLSGDLPGGALDTYEQERKPHARGMIRLAKMVGQFMTAGGEIGNLLRRFVLPRLSVIPGVRDRVVDSTTPTLRKSAFVQAAGRPRRLAGTLCPNTIEPSGRRLDDVLGIGFAVVTTAHLDPAHRATIELRGASVYVAEPGTVLARWLNRGRCAAAVIRPDRTVMQTARRAEDLIPGLPTYLTARTHST